MKAAEQYRPAMRKDVSTVGPATVTELVNHYIELEMTEESGKSFSTRTAYQSYFTNWIVPVWGLHRPCDVRTVQVEKWLHSLQQLAPGTKAKLRNIMSAVFSHALRY
jgi:hypothetical protein